MQSFIMPDQGNLPHYTWRIAFTFLLLLPWMLILTPVGLEICVAMIGIMFLQYSRVVRDWGWLKDPVMLLAVLSWIWLVLGVSPFALLPERSLSFAVPWIRYMLLFAAMRTWLLRRPEDIKMLAQSCALALVVCAMDTAWQYMYNISLSGHATTADLHLTGPFKGAKAGIYMAKLLIPTFAVGIIFASPRHYKYQLVVGLSAVCCILLIFLSGSRLAFIFSFFAVTTISMAVAWGHKNARLLATLIPLVILAAVTVLLATQDAAKLLAERTEHHIENYESSTYGSVLKAGWYTGVQHWQTGVGMEGFRELSARSMRTGKDRELFQENYAHPHNPYLEWFAEAGLPGLLLFIATVGILLKQALKSLGQLAQRESLFAVSALAILVMNFFPVMTTTSYFNNWAGILTWFSVGFVYSLLSMEQYSRGAVSNVSVS